MNDFVAIDLETASRFHNSACALGLVVVNDGAIVEKMKWFIRPPHFDRFAAMCSFCAGSVE